MMTNKELEDAIYKAVGFYRDANEAMRETWATHIQELLAAQIARANNEPGGE